MIEPCGCKTDLTTNSCVCPDDCRIAYCKMHAAASEMFQALCFCSGYLQALAQADIQNENKKSILAYINKVIEVSRLEATTTH